MRRLLTTGIKAILAIAALTTAAHWVMRVQREAEPTTSAIAAVPEPATTGSIAQRKVERASTPVVAETLAPAQGLDQLHLTKLFANATTEKPKAAPKAVAKR